MLNQLLTTEHKEIALKLILSFICSGLIGWEREKKNKSAGLRTCIFVSLATTIAMIFAMKCFENTQKVDLTRLASGCVQGLGFLGAGVILHQKDHVEGLTTAAIVWAISILGLIIGYGMYFLACLSTLLFVFTAYILPKMRCKN